MSVSCQFRSTHLQCSTNPANLPIRLSNAYYIRPNREPIRRQTCANPVPIICQSRSIQCQYDPAPASIWWPSGSIHCQSSSISVPILGQSNTNPVSILDNPPIKCQSWTYLPNSDPWPICQFNANSIPSCPSITNPQIQYQSPNPLPICQSITNQIPIPGQSDTNPRPNCQSITNLPIHCQYANQSPI